MCGRPDGNDAADTSGDWNREEGIPDGDAAVGWVDATGPVRNRERVAQPARLGAVVVVVIDGG